MTYTCAYVIFIGWVRVPRLEPLARDFVLLGQKLESLGFIYGEGKVIVA